MRHNTMSWNFYGEEIRDHSRIRSDLAEAARLGFRGVQAQLRDYSYQIDQPEAVAAVKRSKEIAQELGLQFWLQLDPRDAAGSFLSRYPQARQRTVVPVEAGLADSAYHLVLDHSYVSSDHKQHCTYDFEAVERVFAYRLAQRTHVAEEIAGPLFADTGYINWADRRGETEAIESDSVVDITSTATAAEAGRRVTAIDGHWSPPSPGPWKVMALVRLALDTFDYASPEGITFQHYLFDLFRRELGSDLDGILSDEPGQPYPYHYLTPRNGFFVGDPFYTAFAARRGYDLRDKVYALVRETSDGQAGKIRCDYYSEWADVLYRFQKDYKDYALGSFGPHLKVGIHANASEWAAADLQKGTLDYWKLAETTTDGYTDGKHHDRYNAFFHVTVAKSLAKLSDSKLGYTQTWDMFPTAASEDYWSDVAAVYGLRWEPLGYRQRYYAFASAAGARAILEDRWENMARVNAKMSRLDDITRGAVAEANVLAIFPLETIMRLGNEDANHLRRVSHLLSYHLQAAHYQTDFMTPELLARGQVVEGKLQLAGQRYDAVVYPFPGCMPAETFAQIERLYQSGGQVILFGCPPSEATDGQDLGGRFADLLGIRPLTRLYDYIDPDPTTPYTGTVSFVGELAGIPTVNIKEGMFSHVPWHQYFWPIVPAGGSPVTLNLRWSPEPLWIGCLRTSASGGRLLFLGFDCSCVAGADRLFDHLLRFLQVPRLVEAPAGVWTGLVRQGDNTVVLCCKKDERGPFSAQLHVLGHTIEFEGAQEAVAVALGKEGTVVDVVAGGSRRLTVDGTAVQE